MDSNTFPKLIEEMEKSIKDLCENLLTLNDLTDNQQQILNFFTENF
ncbi:hypothetical protein J6T66_01985 [bacterium]|nr:hypothetical protein [bacterium]